MIAGSLEVMILVYLAIGFSGIGGLWYFYDRRDKQLYQAQRSRVIFHCIKCGNLYARRKGTEVAPCNKCDFKNPRLKF